MTTASTMCKEAAKQTIEDKVPWYLKGGITWSISICRINIYAPLLSLCTIMTGAELGLFVVLWVAHILAAKFLYGMKTELCIFNLPTYITFVGAVALKLTDPILIIAGVVLGVVKITVCMSCCLHRYAAHTAFKCGPVTKYAVCVLACLANQGGPIWWAAHHRCHHKFCDLPRDPHSPSQVGFENAFAFFQYNRKLETVNEEFVPRHLDEPLIRFLDTFAFFCVSFELLLSYYFFGFQGLFLAYMSGWVSQVATLAFNCAFHPAEDKRPCKSTNFLSWSTIGPQLYFPAFFILAITSTGITPFVGESLHETHHDFPQLAKRDSKDMGWYLFVYPLMKLGLIWDVHLPKTVKAI